MRLRLSTLAIAAVLAGAACRDATGPTSQLVSARARWLRARPVDYTMALSVSCFCGFPPQPVTITVHGDSVRSAIDAHGAPVGPPFTTVYASVDALFRVIDDAIARSAYRVDVTYDARYGYPRSIQLDYERNVADDEVTYTVSSFVAR